MANETMQELEQKLKEQTHKAIHLEKQLSLLKKLMLECSLGTILTNSNEIKQEVNGLKERIKKIECITQSDQNAEDSEVTDKDKDNEEHQKQTQVQKENNVFNDDTWRHLEDQIANVLTIENIQAQDYQQQLLEKDKLRLQLLNDLKTQEESHLLQMEQLKLQLKSELEAKDKLCLELENKNEQLRGDYDITVSCSICFEQWNSSGDHRLVSLPCGHLFGDKCIRTCIAQLQECPQCRAPAGVDGLRYLYGRP